MPMQGSTVPETSPEPGANGTEQDPRPRWPEEHAQDGDAQGEFMATPVAPLTMTLRTPWDRLVGRLPDSLRKALFGLGWVGLAMFSCQAMRLLSSLILTRLLNPA